LPGVVAELLLLALGKGGDPLAVDLLHAASLTAR
jgi:hypothetical protein